MKVILRKNDSATSLLLFIYNNYFTHYKKDTLKLSSLLEIMKVFGKSETATRMSLSRAVKTGILDSNNDGSKINYCLTSSGKEAINAWNEGMNRFWKYYALRNKPWDNKWHLINLEFGEKYKEHRTVIAERLQQIGFRVLSTNTWITPYSQSNEMQKLLTEFSMKTALVEMHGEITIHQDVHSFVENVFHLKELEQPYKKFIEKFGEKFEETKQIYLENWFIMGGQSLPLLHALGWEFFSIASEDVVLPKVLYPEWAGVEATQLMSEFRSILLDTTIKYLGKYE